MTTATIPATQRAVVHKDKGVAEVRTIPVPAIRDDEVLLKTAYYALNPTDWKQLDASLTGPGTVVGVDVAGEVVAIGKGVSRFAVGDRVAGLAVGNKSTETGGAAEYAVVNEGLGFAVPASLDLAHAATWGIGAGTAAQVLFQSLGHAYPTGAAATNDNKGQWLFVSGGSTAVGSFLIQFAKRAGLRVVATASRANFDFVQQNGADAVVDYHEPDVVAQILRITGGQVPQGAELAGGAGWAISTKVVREGGLASIVPGDPSGKAIASSLGTVQPRHTAFFIEKNFVFTKDFYARVPRLIADGVRPTPVTVRDGLDAVIDGLGESRAGRVSATKLVFKVAP
ncbi:Trans-enoyl reductase lepG [Vanrija pseudolonga]|uniref:Trans-enoyl reductase lepG n=1 Tax=Vanrija pseudolonga TaxID=143232 RepID=A0AAF0YBC4_9TREE|nr:Trans-enoyl reductase lepG [Vanrija pseudolonga]